MWRTVWIVVRFWWGERIKSFVMSIANRRIIISRSKKMKMLFTRRWMGILNWTGDCWRRLIVRGSLRWEKRFYWKKGFRLISLRITGRIRRGRCIYLSTNLVFCGWSKMAGRSLFWWSGRSIWGKIAEEFLTRLIFYGFAYFNAGFHFVFDLCIVFWMIFWILSLKQCSFLFNLMTTCLNNLSL